MNTSLLPTLFSLASATKNLKTVEKQRFKVTYFRLITSCYLHIIYHRCRLKNRCGGALDRGQSYVWLLQFTTYVNEYDALLQYNFCQWAPDLNIIYYCICICPVTATPHISDETTNCNSLLKQ